MPTSITAQDAHTLIINGEAILLDVREPDEFSQEHIAYATSIPLGQISDILKSTPLPANKKLIFQCLKGKRGEHACVAAQNIDGINNEILNLEDGINGWKQAGLATIGKAADVGISIFRQVQIIVGSLIALLVILGFTGITIGFAIAGILGAALLFAGVTGWCGLAMLLKQMPWNK